MVPIGDEGKRYWIGAHVLDKIERMTPGHIRIGHALQDVGGRICADQAAEQ